MIFNVVPDKEWLIRKVTSVRCVCRWFVEVFLGVRRFPTPRSVHWSSQVEEIGIGTNRRLGTYTEYLVGLYTRLEFMFNPERT